MRRASVIRDCAGNEGFIAYSGATGTGALRLPLRETVVIDARPVGRRRAREWPT